MNIVLYSVPLTAVNVPLFYGDSKRYFGVELEIDGAGKDDDSADELLNIANEDDEHIYIKSDSSFAFAHNVVLYNDILLQKTYSLPKTKIETDSYVAVQLIEKYGSLDFDSLINMAEDVM